MTYRGTYVWNDDLRRATLLSYRCSNCKEYYELHHKPSGLCPSDIEMLQSLSRVGKREQILILIDMMFPIISKQKDEALKYVEQMGMI